MNYEQLTIYDRSHWGLLQIKGEDRLRYLHNQSTNNFERLSVGEGCETVFVTSTARTIDLATTYITEDAVLVLVSTNRREALFKWLDKFIFPFDRVELKDVSADFAVFNLIGIESSNLLEQFGIENLPDRSLYSHELVKFDGIAARLAVGSGLTVPGYTIIVSQENGENLWTKLTTAGAITIDENAWEQLRIQQGRPKPDRELTEDYNPLEAGLWHTISFEKGCYIGQETIARLNTYKGVKQKLWGIKLDRSIEPGTFITVEDNKVGVLTSCTKTPEGSLGLGYIRTKAGGVGLKVRVGEATGEVIDLPYLHHE
jgi:tRNA-modifying protein YgfZ